MEVENESNFEIMAAEDQMRCIRRDGDISLQEGSEIINNGYVFNPYNPLNVEITPAEVRNLLSEYGVPPIINNFALYKRAFVHKSYVSRPFMSADAGAGSLSQVTTAPCPKNCLPLKSKSNERLEFVGDGVLELAVKFYLYRRFTNKDEGFMTTKKIELVKNESIGKHTFGFGLQRWYILSQSAESSGTRNNLKRLGCLFEAFVGALFLDMNNQVVPENDCDGDRTNNHSMISACLAARTEKTVGLGFQMAQIFIENILERHVDWDHLIHTNDNYKKLLQDRIQKKFKVVPYHKEVGHSPTDGYEVNVYLFVRTQPNTSFHTMDLNEALHLRDVKTFANIYSMIRGEYGCTNNMLVLLGGGRHRIKIKAEQLACEQILKQLDEYELNADHK